MRNTLILFFLFVVAILLRFAYLPDNLFFGPEQGRDFLVIKEIVTEHNITLIGPKTDIAGVFHGPLFYYLSALPFALSNGDPLVVSFFLIVFNSVTVFFLYVLGVRLQSRRVGIIAALLFAISFYAIVNARWLSNPPLSIPFAALALYFLVDFLKGEKKSLLAYSLVLGLLNQAEFLNILFTTVFTSFVGIFFFNKFKKTGMLFLTANLLLMLSISLGSFVFFDLRHDFLIAKSLTELLVGETGFSLSLMVVIQTVFSMFFHVFSMTVVPFFPFIAIILFIAMHIVVFRLTKKEKLYRVLFLWLFLPVVLLIVLRHDVLEHFFVSLIPAFILIAALFIDRLFKKSVLLGVGICLFLACLHLFMWGKNIPQNTSIFFQSTQLDLRYRDELATIDRIYKEAGEVPFAIQAYTIPYWSQEAWQYLFWSYGNQRYGGVPVPEEKAKKLFVIIQDDPESKKYQQDWLHNTVSKWGETEENFRYGILTTRKIKLIEK